MRFPLLRLVTLAGIHAGLGLGAAVCVEFGWQPQPAQGVFDAVFFADAGLLGIWAGFGRHSKALGFIGFGLGLAYLGALAAFGLRPSLNGRISLGDDIYVVLWVWLLLLALASLTIAVMVAAALALRQRNIRLVRFGADMPDCTDVEPLQFSILQLMLLVLVVAVLIKIGPFARTHLNDYHSYTSSLVAVVAGSLCFGGVTLVAAWGALATRQPLAWSLVAVALSAAIGLLPPYYFPQFLTADFAATSATTALQATFVCCTLLAVRPCGYRLVRGENTVTVT